MPVSPHQTYEFVTGTTTPLEMRVFPASHLVNDVLRLVIEKPVLLGTT
jgi:hypothetical protein